LRVLAGLLCLAAAGACWPGLGAAATLSGEVEVLEGAGDRLVPLQDRGNAVIFVAGFQEPPPTGRAVQLVQENKSFLQRVLVVTQGETVFFPNRDAIYHNVWSSSRPAPFDLGLYKAPETRGLVFGAPGIVTVFCNIHPQMIATILVLPNTRYAVTGPDGRYRIDGIPAGEHAVYAWVEGAQPLKQVVRFERDGRHRLGFRLQLQRIPVNHLNKEGKPYRKYAE
jgi:plastocyanin